GGSAFAFCRGRGVATESRRLICGGPGARSNRRRTAMIFELANPKRFMDLSGRVVPWLAVVATVSLAAGRVIGMNAPPDCQQGDTVKIMILHVPAAWVAMMVYGLIAVCSLVSLVNRHPLADVAARAAAPLGAGFTALGLITGSLWGRP